MLLATVTSAQLPTHRFYPGSAIVWETKQDGHFLFVNHEYYILRIDLDNDSMEYFDHDHDSLPVYQVDIIDGDSFGNVYCSKDSILYIKTNNSWTSYLIPGGNTQSVLKIEAASPSDVWLCSSGSSYGLAHFDGTQWTTYSTLNSALQSNNVQDIDFDSAGHMWIATFDGLFKYDSTNWTVYNTTNSSLPSNALTTLFIDDNNVIWLGTYANGAVRYDGTNWTSFTTTNSGLSNNSINEISVDTAGVIYFGTQQGLSIYNGSSWTVFTNQFSQSTNRYVRCLATWNTSVYTGSVFGLIKYDGAFHDIHGTFPHYSALRIDSTGTKTFGSYYRGYASAFDGHSLNTFSQYDSTSAICDSLLSLLVHFPDSSSGKWTCVIYPGPTITQGGVRFQNASVDTTFTTTNSGLPSNSINDIVIDTSNNKWFGTVNGIAFYNDTTWTVYNSSNSGLTSSYAFMLELNRSDNTIWALLPMGVAHFENGTWITYNSSNSLIPPNTSFQCFKMDSHENLWIGSNAGLFKVDTSFNWTHYDTLNSGLTDLSIKSLAFDKFNKLWIGSSGDLCSFNGNFWATFSFPFTPSMVTDIVVDEFNNKWCSEEGYNWFIMNEHGIQNSALYPIQGTVFYDSNQNGIIDSADYGLPGAKVILLPDSEIAFTDGYGKYYFNYNGIIDTVMLVPDSLWLLTTDSSYFEIDSIADITTMWDFGLFQADTTVSSKVTLVSPTRARCDQPITQWTFITNTGNVPLQGEVQLYLDTILNYVYSFPLEDSIYNSYDTVSWNYGNILPAHHHGIQMGLSVPGFMFIGDTTWESIANYDLINSVLQLSDRDTSRMVITCSYDPNNKFSFPEGDSSIHHYTQLLPINEFTYLINFQNTGNDTAYNVIILDSIDTDLDLQSFSLIAASHNVNVNIDPNTRCIRFVHNNIMLVDSNMNEPLSHGFVMYSLQTIPGLTDSTQIENTASILFDANPPVITNTAINTLVINPPNSLNEELELDNFQVWPTMLSGQYTSIKFTNDTRKSYIIDFIDAKGSTLSTTQTSSAEINVPHVEPGIYFLRFINLQDEEIRTEKIIVSD